MQTLLFALIKQLPLVEERSEMKHVRHLVSWLSALVDVQTLEHVVVFRGAVVAHVLLAAVTQEQPVRVETRLANWAVHV